MRDLSSSALLHYVNRAALERRDFLEPITVIISYAPSSSPTCCLSPEGLVLVQERNMNDELNRPLMQLLPIDQRPGTSPEITSDGPSLAYVLQVGGARDRIKLVIRCDDAGDVWMSIRRAV
jgi:hypothetical protein